MIQQIFIKTVTTIKQTVAKYRTYNRVWAVHTFVNSPTTMEVLVWIAL